jgi:hypothetical protein
MTRRKVLQSLTEARSRFGIAFLLLLPFIFFWRETLGLRVLGDQDAVFWFFPAYREVVAQLRSFHFPFWNPYVFSGVQLFASWQAGVLDPLNLVYLVLGVSSRTLTMVQQLSFSLAALATYAYARAIGVGRRGSVVAGVIYAFCGYPVARTLYPGLLHVAALFPLSLLMIERTYHQGGTKRGWRVAVIGALVFAWQIFAGHPQPLVYSSLLSLAYVVFRACSGELTVLARWRFVAQTVVIFVAGVFLAAVQLLPAYAFAANSVRQTWSFEMFTLHSLHPLSLLVAVMPFLHGGGEGIYHLEFWGPYWHHNEGQIYLGVLAISLAIGGAVLAWRSRYRIGIFWASAGVVGVILSLGKYSGPAAWLLYRVPLINSFRSPNRYWMIVTLSVAVLAGYALDRSLWHREALVDRVALRSSIVLFVAVALVAGIVSVKPQFLHAFFRTGESAIVNGFGDGALAELWVPVATALISLIVIIAFARSAGRARYFVLLGALILDYNLYARFAPTGSQWGIEDRLGSALLQEEIVTGGRARSHLVINPAAGEFSPLLFYGTEMATGYDPLLSARYKRFAGIDESGRSHLPSLLRPSNRTLDLLNVDKIMVAPQVFASSGDGTPTSSYATDLLDTSRWKDRGLRGENRVFENRRVLPRSWLVAAVRIAEDDEQLRLIHGDGEGFDPREVALVAPADASAVESLKEKGIQSGERQVEVVEQRAGHMTVNTGSSQPEMLVVSENFDPGWKSLVDGEERPILRVNYMLRGVVLPAGSHRVEFSYSPRSVRAGLFISLCTVIVMIGLWAITGRTTTE